jgi:hypothetical protein
MELIVMRLRRVMVVLRERGWRREDIVVVSDGEILAALMSGWLDESAKNDLSETL